MTGLTRETGKAWLELVHSKADVFFREWGAQGQGSFEIPLLGQRLVVKGGPPVTPSASLVAAAEAFGRFMNQYDLGFYMFRGGSIAFRDVE